MREKNSEILVWTPVYKVVLDLQEPVKAVISPDITAVVPDGNLGKRHRCGWRFSKRAGTHSSSFWSLNRVVINIAGYFEAGISPDGAAVVPDAKPGKEATLWLAFKWEGMQPLALYPTAQQQAQPFFWVRRGGVPDRLKMLRCSSNPSEGYNKRIPRKAAGIATCSAAAGTPLLLGAARRHARPTEDAQL